MDKPSLGLTPSMTATEAQTRLQKEAAYKRLKDEINFGTKRADMIAQARAVGVDDTIVKHLLNSMKKQVEKSGSIGAGLLQPQWPVSSYPNNAHNPVKKYIHSALYGSSEPDILEGASVLQDPVSYQQKVSLAVGNPRVRIAIHKSIVAMALAEGIDIERAIPLTEWADQFLFTPSEVDAMIGDLNKQKAKLDEEYRLKCIHDFLGDIGNWKHGRAYIIKLVKDILQRADFPITRNVMRLYNTKWAIREDKIEATFIRDELQKAHDETSQNGFTFPDDEYVALTVLKITINWSGLPWQPGYIQHVVPFVRQVAKRNKVPEDLIRTYEALLLK